MSIAKIVAALVERGEEELAEELVSLAGLKSLELAGGDPKFMLNKAQRVWPDITYHGKSVFDTYIKGMKQLEGAAKKAKTWAGVADDVQECYLGYSPKSDMFVCAFDAWKYSSSGDSTGYVWVTFKMVGSGLRVMGAGGDLDASGTFYQAGYKDVHKGHKDLIDLRLD
jgi:hypothetical protein